jgi:hypothetical protein
MKPLIITNKRGFQTNETTIGVISLSWNKGPFCFLLEDEYRHADAKVMGETRIPAGIYELRIREQDTPLTLKHQNSKLYKGWFRYHIEVLDVPNFSGIYFHAGNRDDHTGGCQIPGTYPIIYNKDFEIRESIKATKRFYKEVYPLLENNETVFYNIID